MKMIYVLFLFALLSFTSHAAVNDFCVADLKAGNTTNTFNAALTSAFVADFLGVNGLGVSAARLDIAKGGSIPMHTHLAATELLIMVQGQISAGFMTPTALYTKTLKPGDIMVFPQGQLHFQVNSGNGKTTAFLAFSGANPEAQLLDLLLFGNSLPSELVAQTTFLEVEQVKKVKARFGGRG
ncbi:hypothetical protein AAZV13_16G006200 [Glycine max]|uniref:Germin-like protein n=1 Tax=Glycine max TaxID=3847 RepID=I1MK06_SOYBN|nr:hypothetical protein GYH30_043751 [Glycine max]